MARRRDVIACYYRVSFMLGKKKKPRQPSGASSLSPGHPAMRPGHPINFFSAGHLLAGRMPAGRIRPEA